MRFFRKLAPFLIFTVVFSQTAHADFWEVGGSINYRRSAFDSNNLQELIAYTASVSYYFMEMSALELSYTNGYSNVIVKSIDPTSPTRYDTQTNFNLLALDFVFTFGEKEDEFQPYVKFGGGYLKKEEFLTAGSGDTDLIARQEGMVPSGGFGFRILLTKTLSLKLGMDTWTSPLKQKPLEVDYAGNAGFSWLF